jgi:UDP-N-acetylmuramoyl-tripeptide--D-alanyl-D-alanine ligase
LAGKLFFALRGPHYNANSFACEALEKGALAVVVDDPTVIPNNAENKKWWLVTDVLKTLQDLAVFHRKKFDTIPCIAITGSNGKTTTKELINKILSKKYQVCATPGNYNNHIGLPLTLLSLRASDEVLVLEMGDNKPGDISALCQIALPTHGLITNIGEDHLAFYGDIKTNAATKCELLDYLVENNGTIFINTDEPFLLKYQHELKYLKKNICYGTKDIPANEFSATIIKNQLSGITIEIRTNLNNNNKTRIINRHIIQTQLPGVYNLSNVLAAWVVGYYLGVNTDECTQAISQYRPTNNRSQLIEFSEKQILLDAYNANPSSMRAALHNLAQSNYRLEEIGIVLGDMLELGIHSISAHQAIGELLNILNFGQVILIGNEMKYAALKCPRAHWFENTAAAKTAFKELIAGSNIILLKGSRALRLESLIETEN